MSIRYLSIKKLYANDYIEDFLYVC